MSSVKEIKEILDQWESALGEDIGVPEKLIDQDDIRFNEWIRVMITDEDGKIKEMYDQHVSEINLPKDIKDQIRKQDTNSMCYMIVKSDDNDKVLDANIYLGCKPVSCSSGKNDKPIKDGSFSFDFHINKPDTEVETTVNKCADELRKQLSDKWK